MNGKMGITLKQHTQCVESTLGKRSEFKLVQFFDDIPTFDHELVGLQLTLDNTTTAKDTVHA